MKPCIPNSSSIEPSHDGHHNSIGKNFDPTTRMFSRDELRPQPIIKKKRKVSKRFFKKIFIAQTREDSIINLSNFQRNTFPITDRLCMVMSK